MMKNEMIMLRVSFIAPLYDSGHSYSLFSAAMLNVCFDQFEMSHILCIN